ncbi:MAG TPA: HDOD domain-containing protein [Phycisphaerales bacterium]|nr:HDOD domain-containing protein [Phycisphaerales bacterium]
MKLRSQISASELGELYQFLDRKLEGVGLNSQPEVAIKLLEISRNKNAQLADYAKLIRNDQAVSGRVLRLANSAFFAQRRPVTTIDRACVVLGTDRLKAVALGFHLSRACQTNGDKDFSRKIWGESLYRACLASQLAKFAAPGMVSEAFVIGLMMDAGLPIMTTLLKDEFRRLRDEKLSPGKQARVEHDTLPFTHVDVMTALMHKWKLPELLVKPIELHHTKPPEARRDDPVSRLHRVAYVVGLIELDSSTAGVKQVTENTPGVKTAQRILTMTDSELTATVTASVNEYSLTSEMFKEIAEGLTNLDELMEHVQRSLVEAVDSVIEADLTKGAEGKRVERLEFQGRALELARDDDGYATVYLVDSAGNRLVSHRFAPGQARASELCDALGLEDVAATDVETLQQTMRRLAA